MFDGFAPTHLLVFDRRLCGPRPGNARAGIFRLCTGAQLGTADSFAVLGASTVTNTGPTVISGTAARPGNVGVSPGSAIVGFPPGILTGPGATFHVSDALAIQAQIDLTTAYNTLTTRPTTANLTGQNLGGLVLVPGV